MDIYTQWNDTSLLDFTPLWTEEHIEGNTCVSIERSVKSLSDCAKRQTFFCYTWKPDLIVVPETKTWEEALKYCRINYTDLVSITTDRDYLAVNSKLTKIQTTSFWTSLRFLDGSWYWVNQIYMDKENTIFLPSCPTPGFHCGSLKAETNVLENRNCEEKMHFICYKQRR
ncbi:putative C-type lectin domain family 20 member A [Tachysurus ichikawai]